ncbi:MAG: helix-turn-helix domain-containing protein [Candidatus Thermoplasmatota archaeon]|nr:helix-turn-helix domain-containing protein [Candidatus Thermoplasmatota archaeon]
MKTYRFRIYPTDVQIYMLNSTLELCRQIYNAMLQQRIYAFRSGRKDRYSSITYTQSGFRIMDNGHVWLSKIGEVRMFMKCSSHLWTNCEIN